MIERLLRVWPTDLSGIEGTRVFLAALARCDITARPCACDLWIGNRHAVTTLMNGTDVSIAYSIERRCDDTLGEGWGGHLLAVGDDWMVDLMVRRYHDPDRGIVVPGWLASTGTPMTFVDGDVNRVNLANGGMVLYRMRPNIARFRQTPAWRSARTDRAAELVDEARRQP